MVGSKVVALENVGLNPTSADFYYFSEDKVLTNNF